MVDTTILRYLDFVEEYNFEKVTAHHDVVPCRYAVAEWEVGQVLSLFSSGALFTFLGLLGAVLLQFGIQCWARHLRQDANEAIADRLRDDERIRVLRHEASLQAQRDEEERLRQVGGGWVVDDA